MAQFFDQISDKHRAFIEAQKMFFVATAPTDPEGHVNVSPKGMDTFRVLDPGRVTYLDVTGSGNETAAHLRENGRITVMFCAVAGAPLILRLFGRGRIITQADAAWEETLARFPRRDGPRQVMEIDVTLVQTACGFGVPLFDYVGDRDTLDAWASKKGPEGLRAYWREKNLTSLDGLPTGLPVPAGEA